MKTNRGRRGGKWKQIQGEKRRNPCAEAVLAWDVQLDNRRVVVGGNQTGVPVVHRLGSYPEEFANLEDHRNNKNLGVGPGDRGIENSRHRGPFRVQ